MSVDQLVVASQTMIDDCNEEEWVVVSASAISVRHGGLPLVEHRWTLAPTGDDFEFGEVFLRCRTDDVGNLVSSDPKPEAGWEWHVSTFVWDDHVHVLGATLRRRTG